MMYEIVLVGNGYMVRKTAMRGDAINMDEVFVFNTWDAAQKWLKDAFENPKKR